MEINKQIKETNIDHTSAEEKSTLKETSSKNQSKVRGGDLFQSKEFIFKNLENILKPYSITYI